MSGPSLDWSRLPPGTVRLLAEYSYENATATAMVGWAVTALSGGWDSPSLRVLAGLDLGQLPSFFEAAPYLVRAMEELGVLVPPGEELVRAFVDQVATDILSGRMDPREGVADIHRVAVSPLSHPPDLQPWCDLDEGFDPQIRAPAPAAEVEGLIRAFAQHWLRTRAVASSGTA